MSSSPEMTPMMDPRTQAKLAPMYTIDQILGHNTQGEGRIHQTQDPMSSPSIKGESVYLACLGLISLQAVYILSCADSQKIISI